jgi:hypothetical protein
MLLGITVTVVEELVEAMEVDTRVAGAEVVL